MLKRLFSRLNGAQVRNLIFILLILVGFTIYSQRHDPTPVTYDFQEDCMLLTGPSDAPFEVRIDYSAIRSVSLAEAPELGSALGDTSTKSCLNGAWENETYGVYSLYGWANVSDYVVLETNEGTILCNFESNDATAHLCAALQELLAQKNGEEG